jgi:phosphoglycolate phosphatase
MDRLDRLDIIKYFSRVYCRERPKSSHPDRSRGQGWLDRLPLEKVVELSNCQRKPDERVLREICKNEGACTSESAYVGDSIARDIMMARNAGVFSIWAKYGAQPSIAQYEKLVRVSHWSEKDIVREKELRALAVTVSPDIVLQKSFSELDHVLQPNAVILS